VHGPQRVVGGQATLRVGRLLPDTLLLPHLGYVTTEGYETFYGDAVEDIVAWQKGRPVRELQ
jgi:phosphoglycerate dehydrogenase-like enzyme